ncbi:hypothetical protein PQ689_04845 [Thermoanaerobacterium thermosaccharolyticum]|uniref:hypothetical protein n=1 Tax=Thermoanaerobacterium thermosaccharolyticum TaxID=1517 RepID=UPI003DAA25D0
MKKVAIMTWYQYLNFGTALQVTALSYIIAKMGYQPEVIQYIPHGKMLTRGSYKNPNYYIKKVISKINCPSIINDESRNAAFNTFFIHSLFIAPEIYKLEYRSIFFTS